MCGEKENESKTMTLKPPARVVVDLSASNVRNRTSQSAIHKSPLTLRRFFSNQNTSQPIHSQP
jgi:hypothetical protein